ncbi:DUF2520 domain-containing protein [candidate division KSB1 bacterium]|nr:DUF2520 domain-containing protein [candidate division KSB1 bacterium]
MKTKIAIIGAGRISYSLTSALLKEGYIVDAIISKKNNSAKALAEKFGVKKYSDDINLISKSVNVFFMTVPDSEIKKNAVQLSKLKLKFSTALFIHFSGAEDISVLVPLKLKGGKIGSLHLMQTFPSKKIVKINNVNSAIETNDDSVYKFLLRLCRDLQLIAFRIDSTDKTYYHLAGVFASNFLAGNLFNSQKLLSLNNIDEQKYFDILSSTIHSTLHNIKVVGPSKALSGPVDRGDIKTIRKHISSLKMKYKNSKGNYFSSLLKNYIIQSLNLINLVEEKQDELNKSHQNIRKLLVQELNKIEKSI